MKGYPHGEVYLKCFEKHPRGEKSELSFIFKDFWFYRPGPLSFRKLRNKKERVHLQLGFWSKVQAAEEGEGFTLKHNTIDFEWPNRSKRIGPDEVPHRVQFSNKEAADLIRKMYHSEAFSWTDLRTGETHHALVGEAIRPNFAKLLDYCGIDLDGDSSSSSQSSQR